MKDFSIVKKNLIELFEKGYSALDVINNNLSEMNRGSIYEYYSKWRKETGRLNIKEFTDKDGIYYKRVNVPGFEMYLISNKGDVWGLRNDRKLEPVLNKMGYYRINMYNTIDNLRYTVSIHRMVMFTFGTKAPEGLANPVVDHINGNRSDNRIENLRWISASQNTSAAYVHNPNFGNNGARKLSNETIETIGKMFQDGMKPPVVSYWCSENKIKVNPRQIRLMYQHLSNNDILDKYIFNEGARPKISLDDPDFQLFFDLYFSEYTLSTDEITNKGVHRHKIPYYKKHLYTDDTKEFDLNMCGTTNPDLNSEFNYTDWL